MHFGILSPSCLTAVVTFTQMRSKYSPLSLIQYVRKLSASNLYRGGIVFALKHFFFSPIKTIVPEH